MARRTDPDRVTRFTEFVNWVGAHIRGDEKGEAQSYLDRLFRAYGHAGATEAGAVFEDRVKRPDRRGVGFADLVWGETALVEMKRRGVDLASHVQQMLDYWVGLAGRRPAYCVLCNFDAFWVFDFNKDVLKPVDTVRLAELPDRYNVLAFLFPTGEEPVFGDDHEAVTREAADHLAQVFNSLIARKIHRALAQRFTLQTLVTMFAEDIDLLERHFLTRLLDECKDSPERAYDLLGGLFKAMNTRGGVTGGRYKGVGYFNGGLFAEPAAVELTREEHKHLLDAAHKNWSKVRPEIFGTIFEHSMGKDERHAFGAHFTSQLDILKIVKPTIVDPWERWIERTANGPKPVQSLNRLHDRLQRFRVLDPACGSGNFLYLAYRELKRIEVTLIDTIQTVSKQKTRMFGRVTAAQFYGLDINPFAVELAKVTLMIARKLAIDELHIEEAALPLDNLDANFRAADALIEFPADGSPARRPDWFPADVIIGNPPFLGAKRLKPEHGPDYVNAVRALYPDVPGMADYCVYWIRRTQHLLPECTPDDPVAGRAGLVGTQNIRNNKSREGGLDHVADAGVIVEAVDNQPWSGEANVHVSIVNWVKTSDPAGAGEERLIPEPRRLWFKSDAKPSAPKRKARRGVRKDKTYELEYRETAHINAALSDKTDVSSAMPLSNTQSPQICFQGIVTGYKGFVVSALQRRAWVRLDARNADVVRPYLIGRDLVTGTGQPTRAVIDFGDKSILEAQQFKEPFAYIQDNVLPAVIDTAGKAPEGVEGHARREHLERWWQFWNVRKQMRQTLQRLSRFIAISRVTLRPTFCFVDPLICPDGKIQTFALEDDFGFGVLQSTVHWSWFYASCAKLTERLSYSPRSIFHTFPWPQSPTRAQVDAVAGAGRAIRRIRDEQLPKMKGGLRALYRTLELPGKNPLKDAHAELDAAVLAAYGFSAKKDILKQLLDLNHDVAHREAKGLPVTAPGIPPTYAQQGGDPASLVTDDCIRAE